MVAANAFFFDEVRQLFRGSMSQAQVDGCKTIVSAWNQYGDGDGAKHETADTMQPIHEYGKRAYFNKYEPGTRLGKVLGNTLKGDGYRFRGRGFVQLTGRRNYAKASKAIGLDLVKEPDLALDEKVAARILIVGCLQGWFTGKKLGDYIGPSGDDFINARRVVNGLDDAELIANYARVFHRAVIAGDPLKPLPAPKPIQIGKKPVPAEELPPAKPGKVGSAGLAGLGLFGALLAGALASIGAALGWW